MTMDISTRIRLRCVYRWGSFTNVFEVNTRHPYPEPMIATRSQLTVCAVTEDLIDRFAGELETYLATLTTAFSHLYTPYYRVVLNLSIQTGPTQRANRLDIMHGSQINEVMVTCPLCYETVMSAIGA